MAASPICPSAGLHPPGRWRPSVSETPEGKILRRKRSFSVVLPPAGGPRAGGRRKLAKGAKQRYWFRPCSRASLALVFPRPLWYFGDQPKERPLMPLKASDLSYSDKKLLLNHLGTQIGEANYDQLVSSYDEDGVLDRALQAAGDVASRKGLIVRESWWKRNLGLVIWYGAWLLALVADRDRNAVGTILFMLLLPLGPWLWGAIKESVKPLR